MAVRKCSALPGAMSAGPVGLVGGPAGRRSDHGCLKPWGGAVRMRLGDEVKERLGQTLAEEIGQKLADHTVGSGAK